MSTFIAMRTKPDGIDVAISVVDGALQFKPRKFCGCRNPGAYISYTVMWGI